MTECFCKYAEEKHRRNAVFQLVEKVFFDKLSDFEKHTQTRKKPPSAYKGTVGGF